MHTRYVFSWKCHWLALSIFLNFNLYWIKVHLYSKIILNVSCCHAAERLESSRNPNTWAWIRLCLIYLIQKEEIRKFAKLKADCKYLLVKRVRHWVNAWCIGGSRTHWLSTTVIQNPSLILDSLPLFSGIIGSSLGHTRSLIFHTEWDSRGSCWEP